ncbi:reverse transcriptase domain-containing protein [Tanacetum coccineum]
MSTNKQTPLSQPTSVVRNTLGKEQAPQGLDMPISDEAIREYCDKNYHQILSIIAEKVHQEKVQQEKLKAVKARLNFKETSRHSESGTPSRRRSLKERLGPRHAHSMSGSPKPWHGRSKSPKERGPERKTVFKRLEKGVFHRLGDKEKSMSKYSRDLRHRPYHSGSRDTKSCYQSSCPRETELASEKHHNKRTSSRRTEALSKSEGSAGGHWKSKPKNQKSSVEDDLSQPWAAAKSERWAMPTWCHMFNSTLTGNARVWFDDLPQESIDSYDDLRKVFLENYLQQKKCIKDPVEIHNIKQREGESTEEFVRRYKLECRDVKGAPECMKISGFMHVITNPELIKRLHDKIPKSIDEMMRVTTTFFKGEVSASNRERKKSFPSWKQQEAGPKQNFKKEASGNNKGRNESMTVGHTTDECMHLKRKIKEMLKARKLSHLIKELKQSNGKDQAKATKKEETSGKDKSLAILMVQSWQRVASQKYSNLLSEVSNFFSTSREGRWDGGFRPEVRNQMIPATTPLVGFSGEIIWPFGQISLLVKIGDEEHSTSAWMNFMVVRSPSPYNGIIGRPGVRRIRAVSSTAHGMLKFPVAGGTVTLRRSRIIPLECIMVSGPGVSQSVINQVAGEKIQVAIHPEYLEQTVVIGSTLTEEGRKELCGLLRRNLDIFAWKLADMTGVPRHIAEYMLNIREGCLPVRQKKRGQAPERNKAIYEEVKKLVDAGIMKEVHYHSWLSNPVMVKKHDDGWRMCANFKDLNKACPKDGYPLPEIDWTVESLCGYLFKCFLDAYKGYHEIQMAKEDKEKITFITCAFGMREGTFLGYRLDADGLRGKLSSLNRFLSKSAEKSLPFFKTLKKSDFQWTAEVEMAFKKMKKLIAELPMLTAPKEKEELIMYLAAAKEAISVVLMTERDGKQMPIYFVSRALQGPEVNYTQMEKLILALVSASKRLKRYFQAHTIVVITDQPIKHILSSPEVAGRLIKWRFELEEHDIYYRLRMSVKGQILADFIVERPKDDPLDTPMEDKEELPDPWVLFIDGSSCIDGSGSGLIITNLEGMEFTYALRFRFNATNNEAEYIALIAGLPIADQMGVRNLQANVDSRLVANQVNEIYIAKEPGMVKYLEKVKNLARTFKEFSIKQIPRGENKKADALSKMASTSFSHLSKQVFVEELKEKSIDEKEEILPEEKRKARAIRLKAGPVPRNPQQKLTPITSPWPFYKWGIDIAGPFPEGPGKLKFLIVAVDYFTKWIEAKPMATITGAQVKKDNPFKDWCEKLCICQCFASVKHPQANGLVERANRSLGEGIKARLGKKNKNWLEEISHVLWAHRTMIKFSNRETPFSLTYGTKAVIPVEIGMPTLRTAEVDMIKNDEALEINLDLLEEKKRAGSNSGSKKQSRDGKILQRQGSQHKFLPGRPRLPEQ